MADYYVDRSTGTSGASGTSWGVAENSLIGGVALLTNAGDRLYCRLGDTATAETGTTYVTITKTGTEASPIEIIGVNTSGTEDGTRYKIDQLLYLNNAEWVELRNFEVENESLYSGIWEDGAAANCSVVGCKVVNPNADGIRKRSGTVEHCTVVSAVTGIISSQIYTARYNYVADCSSDGIVGGNSTELEGNVIHNCGGVGIDSNGSYTWASRNTIDGCTSHGIDFAASDAYAHDNRLTNNGGYGINESGSNGVRGARNAFYNNTSGETNGTYNSRDDITLTGDGYTDRANDDFTLTSSAEARRTTIHAGVNDGDQLGYMAAGALTPTDTSSGGGTKSRAGEIIGVKRAAF